MVCWLLQVFCDPDGDTLERLRYNCIGGMLPFGAGILFARWSAHHGEIPSSRWLWLAIALVAATLTVLMSFSFQSWFWIPLVIIIGTIALVKVVTERVLQLLTWFGAVSAAMFVAHPVARKLFITVAWRQDIYDGLMLYVVVTIALSWAVKQIIDRIPSPKP